MPDLFTPLRLGPITLPNRVVMAPLTRCRADERLAPHPLNALYYRQRASPQEGAGLIVSEASQISMQGRGYPSTPGMHTPEQVAGWRLVTDAVHAEGGRIVCQLWHVGRISHREYQPEGGLPVSSWPAAPAGVGRLPDGSRAPRPTPRMLSLEDIRAVLDDYRHAARCALEAGFDGVELHGANGYLPDQFLRDGVNQRTDRYGGPVQNRARFHIEAFEALAEVWGADRVGVRLSPSGSYADLNDSDPLATYSYLVRELGRRGPAYLHLMEAVPAWQARSRAEIPGYRPIPVRELRPLFDGVLIVNAGFDYASASLALREGWADAVAFGTLFISNPDLTARFRRLAQGHADTPFNTPDESTYYTPGEKGYTDYPRLGQG